MLDVNDIHSMTDFLRNSKSYAKKLKRTGRPAVLTVNGQAALVVQDAASYRRTLAKVAEADALRALNRSIADMKAGRERNADDALDALETRHFGKIISRKAPAGRKTRKKK